MYYFVFTLRNHANYTLSLLYVILQWEFYFVFTLHHLEMECITLSLLYIILEWNVLLYLSFTS